MDSEQSGIWSIEPYVGESAIARVKRLININIIYYVTAGGGEKKGSGGFQQ